MIPQKLQIKNFLSYGPETQIIDFQNYNLICLSGKNGHGKSALLDAMTWALWGQARKTNSTSKADEGLVHLGQKHMLVIFDFTINNIHYRVRREFVKTQSTPFAALDFGIVKDDGTFTTLTDKTIKATQTKLEKTIGITYESFINSAFLRQGHANEFSKKSPKERKEILATILQLERFEDLKQAALEKNKIFQNDLMQRQTIVHRIEKELEELSPTLIQQKDIQEQTITLQETEKEIQKIITAHEKEKLVLTEQEKEYTILEIQRGEQIKQYQELIHQKNILETLYLEIVKQQSSQIDIPTLEQEQLQLRIHLTAHQEKLSKRLELKDQYLAFQEQKNNLEKEIHEHQQTTQKTYEQECLIIQKQIDEIFIKTQEQQKKITAYQQQMDKLKHSTLQQAEQHCPMCEQKLLEHHTNVIIEKLEKQITHEQMIIKNLQEAQKKLEQELQVINDTYKKNSTDIIIKEKNNLYQTLIKKIDALKQTAQTLAYDKQAHEEDYKKLQIIDQQLQTHQQLIKEIALQDQRKQQLKTLNEQLKKFEETIDQLSKKTDALKNISEKMYLHKKEAENLKNKLIAIDEQKSILQKQQAIIDLHQQKIIKLESEKKIIEKEIQKITTEIGDFAEIIKALGKDGLQALLIEQALPEIEQQANLLLAQLTDNQTQIFIESLRDLKKGGSKETLDIKISDAVGLRPYEMFSGGEAFRIDFALRIAISKLLARRAGTALQTLIIDEGFGSQDDDGLQLIMDSILKIQDNFAKVIIVSHLPAMKEQFPVQFIVQKKSNGSTVQVIHQG
ncbi:MAG: AAA family ATPase [Candidatus Chromulinivorax sp.]